MTQEPLKIPDYSEELIAELERRQARTRSRLLRSHRLTKEVLDYEINENFNALSPHVSEARTNNKLTPKEAGEIHTAVNAVASPDEQRQGLMGLCSESVIRFHKYFILRDIFLRKTATVKEDDVEKNLLTKLRLNIYGNLITREVMVRIKHYGLTDQDSFRLARVIIKNAITNAPLSKINLMPIDPRSITATDELKTSDEALTIWLNQILGYAEEETKEFRRLHRTGFCGHR